MNYKEYKEIFWNSLKKYQNIILYGAGTMSQRVVKILRSKGIMPAEIVDSFRIGGGYESEDFHTTIKSYREIREEYQDYIILLCVAIDHAMEIKNNLEQAGETNPIYHMMCPFKVDDTLLEDVNGLEEVRQLFSDEQSKNIFDKFIAYKITGNMQDLLTETNGDDFFDRDLIKKNGSHRFVDVGCYTGDTISQFLIFCDGGYEKIWGLEADPGNYKKSELFRTLSRLENLEILNVGGWSERKVMQFHTIMNDNAVGFDSTNLYTDLKVQRELDENQKYSTNVVIDVVCDSLDNLFSEKHPTLIKINALAADQEILIGSESILRNDKPTVVLDYGARPSYVKDTVLYLKTVQPDYRLYLREKKIFNDYKTLLYAIAD